MQVTSITNNPNTNQPTIWNVTRGFAGTTAAAHSQGAYVMSYPELTSYLDAYVDYFFSTYQQNNSQLSLTVNDIAGVPANAVYTATGVTLNGSNYAFAFTSPDDPYGTTYYVYYPFFTDPFTGLGNYNPTYTPLLYPSSAPPGPPTSIGNQFTGTFLPTPTGMVYGAYAAFNDSAYVAGFNDTQQKVLGSLENQISSALNRGVALLNPSQWQDSSQFYKTGPGNTITAPGSAQVNYTNNWNRYSQFFHNQAGSTVTIDGRAYGFPYDDQAGQASDIAVQSFTTATITLGAWNALESIGNSVLVTGTAGDDVMLVKALHQGGFQVQLNGTVLGTINGLAGQLIMQGLDGNDRLIIDHLFAYDAELHGGRGRDILIGGRGNDRLFGGGGKDILCGGKGRNWLDGGPGNDILLGRRQRDVFHGSEGHDQTIWMNNAADPQSVFELARIAAKYLGRGNRSDYYWPVA
jgi:Ca2+-binding RTX toxin-like protein